MFLLAVILFQNKYLVGIYYSPQPMSNHNDRLSFNQLCDCLLNQTSFSGSSDAVASSKRMASSLIAVSNSIRLCEKFS